MSIRIIKNLIKRIFFDTKAAVVAINPVDIFLSSERIPWTIGYNEYKWQLINEHVNDDNLLQEIKNNKLPIGFGKNVDERVVEYPWLFAHLNKNENTFLDAGSTFNFESLLKVNVVSNKKKFIYTFYPEQNYYSSNLISYVYGDLRDLPFKNNFFETVVCHSTLEHVDMDNSIYGYNLEQTNNGNTKNYEYLKVIKELVRVTEPGGKILLTFPFGIFENHVFFQQFDSEMVQKLVDIFEINCEVKKEFMRYENTGWIFSDEQKCNNAISYNPHTGKGQGADGAAHSRAICFIEAIRNIEA